MSQSPRPVRLALYDCEMHDRHVHSARFPVGPATLARDAPQNPGGACFLLGCVPATRIAATMPPEISAQPGAQPIAPAHAHRIAARDADSASRERSPLSILCLTAIGVVYGDIGTSPLYAIRECFFGPHRVPVTAANVLGVLSLIFWALIIVVTLKYHVYVLRADNRGEGGILALLSLVRTDHGRRGRQAVLLALGLFGAALLYGDGVLTPAISVLSAIEGLEVATPFFSPFVVPITVVILIGLFAFQNRGTTGVGVVFGPIILIWFTTLALLGIINIVRMPEVLAAVNPAHAIEFLMRNGMTGYLRSEEH